MPRHSCSNSSARYSCTCQGLSERGAPAGASVRTLGVETNTAALAPGAGAAISERKCSSTATGSCRCSIVCRNTTASAGSRRSRPDRARSGGWGGGSAAARARAPRGWRPRRRPRAAALREHVRAVALATGHVDDAQPRHAGGDPLIHGQVTAKPIVLGGHVRERALARQLQRGDAVGLVALGV